MPKNLFVPVCLTLCIPLAASGQSASTDYTLIGAGLRSRPAYDGSASQQDEAIPVLRYYGKPWFARTTQGLLEGGARIEPGPGLALGAQIAYEGGRRRSESAFLTSHNVADIGVGASVGVHAELDRNLGAMPVTVLARYRLDTDTALGAQTDLRITAGVYGGARFKAAVFAQATWANGKSTQTDYGITPQQSATTGLPAYDAASGLLFTSVGLQWGFDLSREWVLVGSVEARQLRGDAAGSPLVEDRSNTYASVGLAYRF
ncbi:MAG: MipA/OmpV family protein [Burkholderiales bacterium]